MDLPYKQNISLRWRLLITPLLLAATAILAACGGGGEGLPLQQALANSNTQAKAVALPLWQEISVNNGYLVFSSQALFDKATKELGLIDSAQEAEWYSHFPDYLSMASAHARVNEAADRYMDDVENNGMARSAAQMEDYVGSLVKQNSNAVRIADFEGGKIFEKNITHRGLSMLVNQDGLVSIAGHLYQYSSDTVRSESSNAQPSRVWNLTSPSMKYASIDADPICDMDGHCAGDNNGGGGDHGNSPNYPVVWDAFAVSEGATMVFHVEVPPPTGLPFDDVFDFGFGDGAGSNKADRGDIGLISFNNGVTLKQTGDKVIVPLGVSEFTISIQILDDRREEPQEMVTVRVGNSVGRGNIFASEACTRCQNFEHKGVGTVGHKPAHRLIVYERFEQFAPDDQNISTTYTIQLRSLKKRDWSPYWTNNSANLTAGGSMRGNKIPASFYALPFWGHTYFHVIYDHHIDNYFDAPHVDSASIAASRSGGDEGVWAYINH